METQTLCLDFDESGRRHVEVATVRSLLEFANSVRTAAGAEVLSALLPSAPRSPNSCLIANAVNFNSTVDLFRPVRGWSCAKFPSGAWMWAMFADNSVLEKIAEHLGPEVQSSYLGAHEITMHPCLVLPEAIGNAARAFDSGQAFNFLRNE